LGSVGAQINTLSLGSWFAIALYFALWNSSGTLGYGAVGSDYENLQWLFCFLPHRIRERKCGLDGLKAAAVSEILFDSFKQSEP